MQRRSFLKIGLLSGAALAAAGGGLLVLRSGAPTAFRLDAADRELFRAIGRAVLDGSLPADAAVADRMLDAHLDRVEAAIAGFTPAVRAEVSQLLGVLGNPVGRMLLAGLTPAWRDASVAQVQAALESMRFSRLDLRQQTYHALRDLTNGAYYAEPGTWAQLGYPGPRPT